MNYFKALIITVALAIIFPQILIVTQMGISMLHDGHQQSVPIEVCNKTLPCLSAHLASIPPSVNMLERFLIAFIMIGLIAIRSLLSHRAQWIEGHHHRIRQFLYNRVGVHMHAFDKLRLWISRGMMGQKVTNVSAQ